MPNTTFLLIRHGMCDPVGHYLAGRAPGIHLNKAGQAQATRLAHRMSHAGIEAIYSSPLERAQETAQPLSRALNIPVRLSPALLEIDFGEWTGLQFEELERNEQWKLYNRFRSGTRIPGGEMAIEVQTRAVAELERLRGLHPGHKVALFTHGDVIKSMVTYHIQSSIDAFLRFDISPASVSVLDISEWGPRLLCLADTGEEILHLP